ncbi:MAG: Npun_F0813 family protein [Microcoleaceae cyanobacterium]
MFILKRQDVEIKTVQHPHRDQQIPILVYQSQSFRLMKVFNAQQEHEAREFWRDLTDNRGKACVLLEEPERYSVWGKVRSEQLTSDNANREHNHLPSLTQACLLMLQAVYFDVEDLLGSRQANSFVKDLTQIFHQLKFPQTDTPQAIKTLLTINPLDELQIPSWQENHLKILLQKLYELGENYFGNNSFAEGMAEILEDLKNEDRQQFIDWLNQAKLNQLWPMD